MLFLFGVAVVLRLLRSSHVFYASDRTPYEPHHVYDTVLLSHHQNCCDYCKTGSPQISRLVHPSRKHPLPSLPSPTPQLRCRTAALHGAVYQQRRMQLIGHPRHLLPTRLSQYLPNYRACCPFLWYSLALPPLVLARPAAAAAAAARCRRATSVYARALHALRWRRTCTPTSSARRTRGAP